MKLTKDLSDTEWELLKPLFPELRPKDDGRGRPVADTRAVLNGVLWVMRTGAPWAEMPQRYPPYQTCHRRFQRWAETGVLKQVVMKLADDLNERGRLDLTECFIDGSFAAAKKGALKSAKPRRARAPN